MKFTDDRKLDSVINREENEPIIHEELSDLALERQPKQIGLAPKIHI